MRIYTAGLWFCCFTAVLAQTSEQLRDEQERRWDQHWATITRLPVAEIEELRVAAGIPNGSYSRIESLDTQTLNKRNQILLTEGIGSCLKLHVLTDTARGYSQVWMLGEVPKYTVLGGLGGKEKICSDAPAKPAVHATPDGMIVIEIPVNNYPGQRSFPVRRYWYEWSGQTYQIVQDRN